MNLSTEQIWQAFHADLRAFIARRVSDADDAEDILQEVFIKIHNNIDTLEDHERVAAWTYQIARNAITDYYRRRRPVQPLPEVDLPDEPEQDESLNGVEQEVISWLPPMMDSLPEKYRQALWLTEIEGLSQKQLAERLSLSHSGAKSRVQRGRALLKQQLLDCCHFEFDRLGGIVDYHPHCDC